MAIRTTGLASGLDTESIVKELMSAKSLKKTKIENNKTKLEWKQEKWADLNTKLYKLYTEQVSKLRLQSTYNAKKASSSDETKASLTASSTAANGSYKLEISNVATSQYVTSGKVDDSMITGGANEKTALSELDASLVGKEIKFSNGEKTVSLQIRQDTTIDDFVSAAKDAGLNANYDTKQKRFFISSKESGVDNAFSITSSALSSEELSNRSSIEAVVDYANLGSASKGLVNQAYQSLQESFASYKEKNPAMSNQELLDGFKETDDYKSAVKNLADVAYTQKTSTINTAAKNYLKAKLYDEKYDEVKSEQESKFYDNEEGTLTVKSEYSEKFGKAYDALSEEDRAATGQTKEEYVEAKTREAFEKATDSETLSKVNSLISSDADTKTRLAAIETAGLDSLDEFDEETINKYSLTTFDSKSSVSTEGYAAQLEGLVDNYLSVDSHASAASSALEKLGLSDIVIGADGEAQTASSVSGLALISASDSKVTLNGAELTSSSASLSVNGLSIDLKSATLPGQPITFTVANDTDGIYDSIRNFVKEYNAIMKEMNADYNAAAAKDYDVLTDEEKKAMTDDQIELWEGKIKGSLLRNDSTLNSLMNSMRSSLQTSVEYDGKRYSLSSFGITTSTDYTEGGLLHIYGDPDDATYANDKDKLKTAIENDPDLVASVLSKIGQNLYSSMADKMKASKVSSALTFYNDKQIKSDLEDYKSQIKDWTERLQDMEDDYYAQFSAMEKSMAKLNSQSSYLSGLFG